MYFLNVNFYHTHTILSLGYYLPNRFFRSLASSLASMTYKSPGFKYNVAVTILAADMKKSLEDYSLLSLVKLQIHKFSNFFKICLYPCNFSFRQQRNFLFLFYFPINKQKLLFLFFKSAFYGLTMPMRSLL